MVDLLYRRYADPLGAMKAAGKVYPFLLYVMELDTEDRQKEDQRLEWELFLHSETGGMSFRDWKEKLKDGRS